GYEALILADHGNADCMLNEDGTPNTAHTMNPVPCIFVSPRARHYAIRDGKLGDIAPTILALLDLPAPKEMTGEVLLTLHD
ncbi:MAG: 2,3-bisphosphoglycerate-independent phosphoglycerate mutase, partial [Bacteroidetes bacterium]